MIKHHIEWRKTEKYEIVSMEKDLVTHLVVGLSELESISIDDGLGVGARDK